MMNSSPAMKIVAMGSWLVTSLASIALGAHAMNYDFFATRFMQESMPSLIAPLHYLALAAGVFSLIAFFMCCKDGCGCCSTSKR